MLNLPLSGIKKIEAIAQSSTEYISLSQGALRTGGIPQEVKNYVKEQLNTDKTDYYQSAWGIMELREKIAKILRDTNKICSAGQTVLDSNQILITHGCIGALSSLFFTVLNQGDEIILPEPTYPAYEKLAKLVRAESIFVSSKNNQGGSHWKLDIQKINDSITQKTKIIIFSNPWNPLGITISRKEILELLDICEKKQIYLVIDEAYKDYCFNGSFQSCVDLVSDYEYLIQVSSFSKSMAMSGWRVGYMVASKKLVQNCGKVQDALLNCPNVPAQHAALYALDHPEFTRRFYKTVKENLELTLDVLSPLIKENIFSYQKPSGSFFLFLKTEFDDSSNLCMSILNKAKVALIPGKFFGESGSPFIRLCYARDKNVLKQGLDRLVKYFL